MSQETTVRPELYVKVCMALAVLSLITIAVCQVTLLLRPPPQSMMRRQVVPVENRAIQPGQPALPPQMMPPGAPQGQGMPDGMVRPPQGVPPGQAPEKPAKK